MTTEVKATHTPGPWDTDGHCITDAECGRIVAKAGWGEPWVGDHRTAEANANLIAAAPDLLKVALGVAQMLRTTGQEPKILAAVDAALAKAHGE